MKIAVVGTGGVGGYFGGLLALSEHDVTFVARGEHLSAMSRDGLRLKTVHGNYVVNPVQATAKISDIGPVDLVLVCVKDYQLKGVIDDIDTAVNSHTTILPLLNGVQAADILRGTFGSDHVVGGLCKVVSFIIKPGVIEQTSPFHSVTFGEWDGQVTDRAKAILSAFSEAKIDAELSQDIRKSMWTKFLFITAYSGVASVVGLPAAGLRESVETMELLVMAMMEIERVAQACGIQLDADIVEQSMTFADGLPDDATASMQRDVKDGRLFELEAMTGSVIRYAREAGIDTPVNSFLYAALKPRLIQVQKDHV